MFVAKKKRMCTKNIKATPSNPALEMMKPMIPFRALSYEFGKTKASTFV
jgi:hypothetical protein